MIADGKTGAIHEEAEVAHSRDGTLIVEVSLVQGGNATATVKVLKLTRYISRPQKELSKMLKRNPTMDLAMQSVLSEDLTRKLMERLSTGEVGIR